jgi:hypothetical protein
MMRTWRPGSWHGMARRARTAGCHASVARAADGRQLDIPLEFAALCSIIAAPPHAASTLTTAYRIQRPRPDRITLRAWRHERARSPPSLAVFAAHLATLLPLLAAILPLLPPKTQNVKFAWPANPLEFHIREEDATDRKIKSGKNGNVYRASQHCHPG